MHATNHTEDCQTVLTGTITQNIFDHVYIIRPVTESSPNTNEYKLHINIQADSYQKHKDLIIIALHDFLKSENNDIFHQFKSVNTQLFSDFKKSKQMFFGTYLNNSSASQKRKKSPSWLTSNNLSDITNMMHATLRFNHSDQITLYLTPEATIEKIAQFIEKFQFFMIQNSINPGLSPEYEWPLTPFFSLRKDKLDGKYIDIYNPAYYSGFFKQPYHDVFYMNLCTTLNSFGLKPFDQTMCHTCLPKRKIRYDLLMLIAAENEQESIEPNVYSQLFFINALLALKNLDDGATPDKKKQRQESISTAHTP